MFGLIIVIIIIVLIGITTYALCKIAGDADRRIKLIQKNKESEKENVNI